MPLPGMPPDANPAPDPDERLGTDAQRTRRQKALIKAGRHPATGLRLLGVPGATCGTCTHRWLKTAGAFTGWKCVAAASSRGDGPDLRLWWPACTRYEKGNPR